MIDTTIDTRCPDCLGTGKVEIPEGLEGSKMVDCPHLPLKNAVKFYEDSFNLVWDSITKHGNDLRTKNNK